MKIKCEDALCIYWEENRCILSSVQIDSLGMCDACIHVTLEEEELAQKRKQLLRKYQADARSQNRLHATGESCKNTEL